jgi:hypothetical protein
MMFTRSSKPVENEKEIQEREDDCRWLALGEEDARTEAEKRQAEVLERVRGWGLIVQEKKVFLSGRGGLGLVPRSAWCGDLICVVYVSKAPCVLRRMEGSAEYFRVLGQCYLDGWMYGEAPAGEGWGEGGVRRFTIV